jgi:hypothetical protein
VTAPPSEADRAVAELVLAQRRLPVYPGAEQGDLLDSEQLARGAPSTRRWGALPWWPPSAPSPASVAPSCCRRSSPICPWAALLPGRSGDRPAGAFHRRGTDPGAGHALLRRNCPTPWR